MDVVFASTSMALVLVLCSLPIEMFTDTSMKHKISYAVVIVSVFQYVRLFMYMLLVSSVSRMILTLQFMVLDTLAFIVLLVVWISISAVFFTTLFQDTTSLVYKDLYTTVFVLFDALLGSYGNIGIGSSLYSLHIVCTILYVYMSNVLLLNYLIAIMSTTYAVMMEEGIFMFKVNLYNYCERYLIAFGNESYCELALHTAPINVLAIPV